MTYTLAGTGNMAHFLAHRFKAAGFLCNGVYGRDGRKVAGVAAIADAAMTGSLSDLKEGADCCILAVSDSALSELARPLFFSKTVLIHTAGSQPLSLLPSRHKGVLWCIYSILKEELPQHRDFPVVMEGSSDESRIMLQQIASSISDITYEASFEQRQYLHLSAVIGNNFTNHLMAICEAICKDHGLSFSLLLPILKQTFERMNYISPSELQTGPARRGDEITVERQMDQLQQRPDWQQIYRAISTSIENWYNAGHS